MNPRLVLAVACDLLREARARRWVLFLLAATTLVLLGAALGLRLEVVDGALAATRLFGSTLDTSIRSADVALRPLFQATAWVVFYGGMVFGILACSDFAPALLAPGRIEHLLSLPVRRSELVVGTFLGVLALVGCGALYGGLGLTLIVWVKTGVFSWAPAVAALLGAAGFSAVYAVMVASAVLVRSAALSAAAGGLVFVAGIVASSRRAIAPLFSPGVTRQVFLALSAPLPRLAALEGQADRLADGLAPEPLQLCIQLGGTLLFAAAVLSVAIALLERKDV